MYDRPPLLALEYFVATANLGTVRAASNELHVTPSAISHQIGRLEDFLNVQLFHRHKQRLILTEPGKHYLDQLERSLSQIRQATRDVARHDRRVHLRVSVSPTFLTFFLLPRLSSLLDMWPDLKLSFVDSLTLDPMQHEIDCAIEYRTQTDERLISEKLFDDEVVPVADASYVAKMGLRTLEDVRPCLLIETEKRVFSWDNVLRAFPWRAECRMFAVQYTYQAMTSASLGQGIALANRYNADYLLRKGSLVIPFEIDIANYHGPSYYFSCLPKKQALPTVRMLRRWLDEQIAASRALEDKPINTAPLPDRDSKIPSTG